MRGFFRLEKTMPINTEQLLLILPGARQVAATFVPALNLAMAEYAITSPSRAAAFLAQVGHESAQLTRMVENLNYSAQGLASTWPSRFAVDRAQSPPRPNAKALSLARQPEAIANEVYGGRLGNTAPGDGWRYRGRGLIQLTGKSNYQEYGAATGMALADKPDLLIEPGAAAMAAGWFWGRHSLNSMADTGNLEGITRKINGGLTGYADRAAIYHRALRVLA